jgi:protein yorkie
VQKGASGSVEVASVVYRISGIQTSAGEALFPAHSRNSFCYVAVDPLRRVAKLWYHAFLPFW